MRVHPGALWSALARRNIATPFTDPSGAKGVWHRLSRAGRHVVRNWRVAPEGWPRAAPPLRIALLTDCHVGSHSGDVTRHRAICAEIMSLAPDLVLLLGDYMNMMPLFAGRVPPDTVADIFAGLGAPLGVHAVLGNHDWEYGGEEVARALTARGIAVHENAGVRLDHRGQPVYLAGLADAAWRVPDMAGALAGAGPGEPVIVMSHDPACFADLPPRPGLMVAGHTHAGQWRLPLLGPVWIPGKAPLAWAHGLIEAGGRTLVVSAGTGTTGLPLRINCPPEIAILEIAGPD